MTEILLAGAGLALLLFAVFGGETKKEVAALRREVRALQRTVEGLAAHQGSVEPPDTIQVPGAPGYVPSAEVEAFVAEGRKVAAVKQVREETGLGLVEAKAIVDALEKR